MAALALSRSGRMQVSGATFQDCYHGINASLGSPGERVRDVTISDCTFIDTKGDGIDITLNSGAPETFGVFSNVVIENTRHINTGRKRQIVIIGFNKMVLKDIDIELNVDGLSGTFAVSMISVFAPGDSGDTLKNDDLVIDGVVGRFYVESTPPTAPLRTIALNDNVSGNTVHSPRVKIRNIDSDETAVFPSSGTNCNLVIE